MSLPVRQLLVCCPPDPARASAVFTAWVVVPVIAICSGLMLVMKCHDVESGAVSRPIAATRNNIAALPQYQE